MIISCEQCHKKFEVDSDLIPENGRLLQCNSCNHKWFFKKIKLEIDIKSSVKESDKKISKPINNIQTKSKDNIKNNHKSDRLKNEENHSSKGISSTKILKILIVSIISFVAFIILLDTIKKPLSLIIPDIEFILTSLYETLKDIFLFIKDLI